MWHFIQYDTYLMAKLNYSNHSRTANVNFKSDDDDNDDDNNKWSIIGKVTDTFAYHLFNSGSLAHNTTHTHTHTHSNTHTLKR